MRVNVQGEFNGHRVRQRLKFRVYNPNVKGKRVYAVEYVTAEKWDRKAAHAALTLLDCVYQFKRRNVRFAHV